MSSIDHRVVEMKFNSAQFEKGVRSTTESLAQLENSLQLNNMADGIEKVSSKFNVFGAIGFTAIQKLTEGAIGFGQKIAGAVLDPLVEGGKKRAQNIELAKFQFEGLGLDVEKAMDNALYAVEGTAYGLDEAARAASQFAASGVELGTDMENSLRGVSGLAAMTGSSYEDVAMIFGKVAGQGRLMGDDLNRIGARGVNAAAELAKSFNVTEEELRKMVSKGEIDFLTFANAMNDAFGEHATKANETYSGSLANMRAALSRIGASFAEVKFEKHRRIFLALTPIIDSVAKALGPVVDLFQKLSDRSATKWEERLSGVDFSNLAQPIQAATDVIWNAVEAFDAFVEPVKEAFKAVFQSGDSSGSWLTTLSLTIDKFAQWVASLKLTEEGAEKVQRAFEGFFNILKGGATILGIFGDLIVAAATWVWDLLSSFTSILDPIGAFFDGLSSGSSGGGFLEWIEGVVDSLETFREEGLANAIDGIGEFFSAAGDVIGLQFEGFIDGVSRAFEWLGEVLDTVRNKVVTFFSDMGSSSDDSIGFGQRLKDFWDGLLSTMEKVWEFIQPVASAIGSLVASIGGAIKRFVDDMELEDFLALVNTGVFALLSGGLLRFLKGGGMFSGLKDIFGGVSAALEEVTGVLKSMQTEIKAKAILKIAIAIGILAASVVALSMVNPDNLGASLAAITTLIAVVSGGMYALSKVSTPKDQANIISLSFSLILLSTAVLILSTALVKLSDLDWDEVARGLVGLAGAMGVLVAGAIALDKWAKDLGRIGFQLILFATSAVILGAAVKIFAGMDWSEMGQGLLGFAVSIGVVVGALKLLQKDSKELLPAALALMMISTAMIGFAAAITLLGLIPFPILLQGMLTFTILLTLLTASLSVIGRQAPQMIGAAAAIMAIAAAMNMLIVPIAILGNMELSTLATGIGAMAVTLGVLAVAMKTMGNDVKGAGAIIAISASLLVLSVAMKVLGSMSLAEIGKALIAIAGALIILGVGAAVLAPVAPVMLTIAAAVAVLGLGLMLAAGSLVIFSIGLTMLGPAATIAAGGIAVLGKAAIAALPALLPMIGLGVALLVFGAGAIIAGAGALLLGVGLAAVGAGLLLIAATGLAGSSVLVVVATKIAELITHAPAIAAMGAAFVVLGVGLVATGVGFALLATSLLIFSAAVATSENVVDEFINLITSLIELIPLVAEKIAEGIVAFATVIEENAETIIGAGVALVENFIQGIIDLIPLVVEAGVTLVTEFLEGMQEVIPTLIELAVTIVESLLDAIITLVPKIVETGRTIIMELINGIFELIPDIASAGLEMLTNFLNAIANNLGDVITAATDVIVAFVEGVGDNFDRVATAGKDTVIKMAESISENTQILVEAGFDIMIDFINGIADTLNDRLPELREAGRNLAFAIADGMSGGLMSKTGELADKARDMVSKAYNSAKSFLGIASPSKLFHELGAWTGEGMALGIDSMDDDVGKASRGLGESAMSNLQQSLRNVPDVLEDIDWDAEPTITPVLDLSKVNDGAKSLSEMLAVSGLSADLNYSQARGISSAEKARLRSEASKNSQNGGTTINYEQNNYSPKELSTEEIYRRTKNQISLLRKGVSASDNRL